VPALQWPALLALVLLAAGALLASCHTRGLRRNHGNHRTDQRSTRG
jgi:hypothetical protein